MFQDRNDVLIREPGNRTFNPPVSISESAKELWEYAVLSENAYIDGWKEPALATREQGLSITPLPETSAETYSEACTPNRTGRLPLPGWHVWDDFPSLHLREHAREVGLYMEVWEKDVSPPLVVVAFRGTEFRSWRDWLSNLRWFTWLARFIPLYKDQYSVVAQETGKEVLENLKKRIEEGRDRYKDVRIITTGHSLGGGLAQFLAYSLPIVKSSDDIILPRVSNVYGFDPSPVTGWFSVNSDLRSMNVQGLKIDRIFEHGEILAYVRLILSYVNPPTAYDPAIREIRYNFVNSFNPFSSHSMRLIACALIVGSGQASIPGLYERFEDR
jgi:pimeloyl-ACP methyl ester carboxylesterase